MKELIPDAIAYRDLPTMQPPTHELRIIADRIVERLGCLSVHDARWLRFEIVMALVEVQRIASAHAADKAREYYDKRAAW